MNRYRKFHVANLEYDILRGNGEQETWTIRVHGLIHYDRLDAELFLIHVDDEMQIMDGEEFRTLYGKIGVQISEEAKKNYRDKMISEVNMEEEDEQS